MPNQETVLCRVSIDDDEQDYYLLTKCLQEGAEGFNLLLSDGKTAWEGMVSEDDLGRLSRKVKMDLRKYTEQCVKALTQQNLGSTSVLYDVKTKKNLPSVEFIWKEHVDDIKFQLGSVQMQQVDDPTVIIRRMFSHHIESSRILQETIKELEATNARLMSERATALKRMEKYVAAKEELEADLYSKFAIVINDKKARIRDLKEEILDLRNSPAPGTSHGAGNNAVSSEEEDTDGERGTVKSESGVAPVKSEVKSEPVSDYDTDDESAKPPAAKKFRVPAASPVSDDSLLLDDGDDDHTPVTNRRRRRTPSSKKSIPSKPVLPKTPSRDTSGPSTKGAATRKTPLRKSSSGASKSSSDHAVDASAMIDDME